jgi:hypothetical protein
MPDTPMPPMSIAAMDAPPAAPSAPLDQSIIQRFLSTLPPAPTAPAQQPAGTLDKIANVLMGVSAGMQGQGAQFVSSLRAERERPQREFEAKQERYEQQRSALTLAGTEAAMRSEERRQDRETRAAERNFERDFQENARRMGFTDQVAIEKLREASQIQRDRERERAADEKQQAAFQQQLNIEKGKLRKAFLDQGAGRHADELAAFSLGQIDTLSPAAEKANTLIQAKIARLQRQGGGGGASGKIMTLAELSDGSIVPASQVKMDVLPPGVTVKRLFSPQLQQPQGAAGGITPEQVQAALKAGRTPAELRASARTPQEQAIIEAAIKASGADKAQAPQGPAPMGQPRPNALGRAFKAFTQAEPIRPSQFGK